jgi:hypothetical protein
MTTVAMGSKLIDVNREKSSLQDLYPRRFARGGKETGLRLRTMGGGVTVAIKDLDKPENISLQSY